MIILTNKPTAAFVLALACAANALAGSHNVPFFPAASDPTLQGFVRVISRDDSGGEVAITAVDDAGNRLGPVTLWIWPGQALHFNSDDLENGNAAKGLSGGIGAGSGDWRLKLDSSRDLEVLAYLRTTDGFLTAMHDVVAVDGNKHWVPIFNPGSNTDQESRLRLINPGDVPATVNITGLDDRGTSSPDNSPM